MENASEMDSIVITSALNPPRFVCDAVHKLQLNSCAFSFNKNDRTQKMLELAHDLYVNDPYGWRALQKLPSVPPRCFNDMSMLWYAQWEYKVTRYILPRVFAAGKSAELPRFQSTEFKGNKLTYPNIVVHHNRYEYEDLTEKGAI